MHETIKEQYQKLRNLKLIDSNKLQYNAERCEQIRKKTANITLPKITNTQMEQFKEHLTEYKKIPKEELPYKFLNLYNSFMLIQKFEDNPENQQKIKPITDYLKNYEYIINLIIESQGKKDTQILDKAMIILHLEINMFCMQYAYLLTETDTANINWTPIKPPEPDQEEEDNLPTLEEIETPEQNEEDLEKGEQE